MDAYIPGSFRYFFLFFYIFSLDSRVDLYKIFLFDFFWGEGGFFFYIYIGIIFGSCLLEESTVLFFFCFFVTSCSPEEHLSLVRHWFPAFSRQQN